VLLWLVNCADLRFTGSEFSPFEALGASQAGGVMAFLNLMSDRVERWLPIPKGLHKFLAVGVVGLATHTGVYTLLTILFAPRTAAWILGLLIATGVTWTLNRRLTFAATGRKVHHEALRYILVTLSAQSVSFAVFQALGAWAPAVPGPLDVIIGAAAATIFSYLGNRYFTFAPAAPPGGGAP
jgi:putative flippase GtrA